MFKAVSLKHSSCLSSGQPEEVKWFTDCKSSNRVIHFVFIVMLLISFYFVYLHPPPPPLPVVFGAVTVWLLQALAQAIKEAKEQHPDMSVTRVVVHKETELDEEEED